jgi:hypothetical protein
MDISMGCEKPRAFEKPVRGRKGAGYGAEIRTNLSHVTHAHLYTLYPIPYTLYPSHVSIKTQIYLLPTGRI